MSGRLVEKVKKAGFEIMLTTSFISLVLPLFLVSRLKQSYLQDKYDVTMELRINPLLNRILERVLDVEQLLIQGGFSFPYRGSLLIVAKRARS